MISIDSKIEIYLYGGSTDMRKGIHGLAMLIEENIPLANQFAVFLM